MDRLLLALRALGPSRILAIFLGLAALIAMIGYVGNQLTTPGLSILYGNLNPDESAAMSQWLDGKGVLYEVRADGSIYVPSSQVGELRLQAAGQGLVGASTTGYEIFDKSSGFGTTSFVQNLNARRALEGELARTIASMPAVSSARVHLVIPERRLFETSTVDPSAAVALNVGGRILNGNQMENISRLVAAAVPNLTTENVTIVDQNGNLIFDGSSLGGSGAGGTRVKSQLETDYEKSIVSMLEKVVGPGKVSVKVTADINTERVEEQSEIFDPTRQAVRSEQTIEDSQSSNQTTPSGVAGLTGQIPDAGGTAGGNATTDDTQARTESTINYEITRTLRNLVREGGDVRRLSVAVLIEGRYTNENGPQTYQPWPDADLDRFRTLVQTAIGFNEERGDTVEIIDMPFSQIPELADSPSPLITKDEIFRIAEYLLLALGIILTIFLVIRPGIVALGNAVDAVIPPPPPPPKPVVQEVAPPPEEPKVNINRIDGRVKESMLNDVNQIIDQHPEESIQLIRNWMADIDPATVKQDS